MREFTRGFESNPEFGEVRHENVPTDLKLQIYNAWERALDEGAEFVRKHKRQSRNGQAVFDRVPRYLYIGINLRLINFPRGEAEARKLLGDIEELIVYVQNYEWPGHFCLACGEPIDSKQLYCFKGCRQAAVKKAERDRFHDYVVPSSEPSNRPKKPGSAAKHGHGHSINESVRPRDRKKGKGGREGH
jgi:hypothetical protein